MLKKFIITTLLSCFSALSQAQSINNAQFLSDYQENVSSLLDSYHQGEKSPLTAQIFDIAVPGFYQFLSFSSNNASYEDDLMAMRFYPNFKVNEQETPFCFILYNSQKHLLTGYLNSSLFSYDNAVQYLSAHEMGHCFVAHQRMVHHFPVALNANQEEAIADSFAIAYFLYKHEDKNALYVIALEKRQPTTDIHSNGLLLEKFYLEYQSHNFTPKNIFEVFQDSFKIITSIN